MTGSMNKAAIDVVNDVTMLLFHSKLFVENLSISSLPLAGEKLPTAESRPTHTCFGLQKRRIK
jgi:hypothetical protein